MSDFIQQLITGVNSGDRVALAKAITYTESSLREHRKIALELREICKPHLNTIRIGITGIPGVGKSTFIDSLGSYLCEQGNKVAVLAVDPSSKINKGSILGDKTRMEKLSGYDNCFIRPSASGGALGGVRKSTKDSISLCEQAGFEIIFVETVGIGQSETEVNEMVDILLLLTLPGTGDELQGIKRGIMELADIIVVHKSSNFNKVQISQTINQLKQVLHLFPAAECGVDVEVVSCDSISNENIGVVWNFIQKHIETTRNSGYFNNQRHEQDIRATEDFVYRLIVDRVKQIPEVHNYIAEISKSSFDTSKSAKGLNKILDFLEEKLKEIL